MSSGPGRATVSVRETLDKPVAHGKVEVHGDEELATAQVQDALAQVRGVRFERSGRSWRAAFGLRSGLLRYELTVTVASTGGATSTVECWLTQTATLRRETIHASLLASVVGIPVALLGRGRSERLERRLVEKVIPGILGALVDANEGHAGYR
jgi:hypothetical protein